LTGNALFGGPGNDTLHTKLPSRGRPPVAHGGSGDDVFDEFVTSTPGWYYGGPGDDKLHADDRSQREPEMFVGGPGRDTVYLGNDPGGVVRLRGGGKDTVRPDARRGSATAVCRPDGPDRAPLRRRAHHAPRSAATAAPPPLDTAGARSRFMPLATYPNASPLAPATERSNRLAPKRGRGGFVARYDAPLE
jgi:hypothetical protein